MLKKYRYMLTGKIEGSFYHLIRAYSWTFRLHIENEKPWQEYLQNGGRVLLCCWHQIFFSAIRHFKTYASYHPALMISQSKDGDIVAGIAEKSGWHAVRGSSSRDGGRALKEMIAHLRLSGSCRSRRGRSEGAGRGHQGRGGQPGASHRRRCCSNLRDIRPCLVF